MKEPHAEGLADHGGPESCAGTREGVDEALTGEGAGWVLSREITSSGCRGADATPKATLCAPSWQGEHGPCAV